MDKELNVKREAGRLLGEAPLLESHDQMTQEQAEQKAQEWSNLIADAECEEGVECYGAAELLRGEAMRLESELEANGHNVAQLLRQIERRRRAL